MCVAWVRLILAAISSTWQAYPYWLSWSENSAVILRFWVLQSSIEIRSRLAVTLSYGSSVKELGSSSFILRTRIYRKMSFNLYTNSKCHPRFTNSKQCRMRTVAMKKRRSPAESQLKKWRIWWDNRIVRLRVYLGSLTFYLPHHLVWTTAGEKGSLSSTWK